MTETPLIDGVSIIEQINAQNQEAFAKTAMKDRVLLIPHCLRNNEKCKAIIEKGRGYICQKCGACLIKDIVTKAESVGLRWYIVAGGSQAIAICKRILPKAALAIACPKELLESIEATEKYHVPAQVIPLTKEGCVNTLVDIEKVFSKIEL